MMAQQIAGVWKSPVGTARTLTPDEIRKTTMTHPGGIPVDPALRPNGLRTVAMQIVRDVVARAVEE